VRTDKKKKKGEKTPEEGKRGKKRKKKIERARGRARSREEKKGLPTSPLKCMYKGKTLRKALILKK